MGAKAQVQEEVSAETDTESSDDASSTEMDAQLIMDHPVTDAKIKAIKNKMRVKRQPVSSTKNPRPERSLETSQARLVEGIRATKFNFSN